MSAWALVTPASRGIGYELARRILTTTNVPLVATARRDVDQTREGLLNGLDNVKEERLHVVKVDVLDEQSIADAASSLRSRFSHKDDYLHLALSIPGILHPEKSPSQIDYDKALDTFKVNTLGPMILLKHFWQFLPKKATKLQDIRGLPSRAVWANMSARVGSISDNNLGGWYSYRASKAALNQVTKTFDNYLKTSAGEQAIAVALHPGTVKTGLSKEFWSNVKEEKLFTPEFASEKLLQVVNSRSLEDRGKIWDWKGEQIAP
ncbi:hypothetical protein AMS68_005844 [Peltaster fructicola]|uniref:NAD(P)-binding protein n=1 Tax=Peltaster fructicola TaxID=286661 RepID=A0A6H0XZZ9_9PEZI|nr:hypothetical protein AMS68_005844 [Peltaster fructicola]